MITEERNKQVIFKNCSPKINNTRVDDAKNLVVVKPMYNLIKYSDTYSKQLEVYGNTTEIDQMLIA